jgi:FkbM family methyltransferase
VLTIFQRAASFLPGHWQFALRRRWCTWQFHLGLFKHDEPEFERLSEWVSEGDCVLDIGANLGLFTAALSRLVGPQGHVFAFEPMPETFRLLTYNSRLFPHSNVTLINAAASSASALVGMEMPTSESGLPDIYCAHVVDQPTSLRSFALPVDALAIPARVSFVKIDVEGHELQVLQGIAKLLREHAPLLVVEGKDQAVKEFLDAHGYVGDHRAGSPNTVFCHVRHDATNGREDTECDDPRAAAIPGGRSANLARHAAGFEAFDASKHLPRPGIGGVAGEGEFGATPLRTEADDLELVQNA